MNGKKEKDYPEWGDTEVYKKNYCRRILIIKRKHQKKLIKGFVKLLQDDLINPSSQKTFYEYIWNGWLCLASPVLSNTGTDRGLPISCFGIDVADSIYDIGTKNLEMMLLAKHGGGVGIGINQIRPAGAKIKGNGNK